MFKKIFFIFLLLGSLDYVTAQEITVQAPSQVYVGDNFYVRFTVNAQATDFQGPSFKGFSLRSGPNTSSQTSMSFVNGQMSSSVSTTFSYTLTADVQGTFTVGPASCNVEGKKINSKSFSIKVEKLSQAQQQQRQQQQAQQQQRRQTFDPWSQQPREPAKIDATTLFARASVDKSNPYQGEQIIVTYKIYTQVPISQFAIDKLPGNKGFWSEDLSAGKQIKQYEETVNGRRYQVAEIRRGALFAQQSGALAIEPLDLNVLAMVQSQRRRTGSIWDLFDDPFFNSAQAVERPLRTNRLTINARALPTAPENFSGAVGSFSVKGGANLGTVKANEALSYRLTISGHGNLMLINPPTPDFPSSFEVYDPQIDDKLTHGDGGISGTRTYEWILIPRSQGEFTIPAYNFVYFNPTTAQYQTLTIEEHKVKVEAGSNASTNFSSGQEVQHLATDIAYIHPLNRLGTQSGSINAPLRYVIGTLVNLLIFIVCYLLARKRLADKQDIAGVRLRRATRLARRRLKKAAAFLGTGDSNRFYEEIYRAIWGCLADKYNIELSQLNRDTVIGCLEEKQVSDAQQQRILKVLQDVDMARFAPGDASSQKQTIYNEALTMIAEL